MPRAAIENGRAAYAYDLVANFVQKSSPDSQKEYRAYVKKLPAMIKTNGLGQTLAFYYAKAGTHRQVYEQIAGWIQKNHGNLVPGDDFIEAVVKLDSQDYRLIATEVIALVTWMRRFADGMIDVKSNSEGERNAIPS